MKFVEQLSFRTNQNWRPKPTLIEEKAISFFGVCFSWGEIDLTNKVLENVRFFIDAFLNQSEITNPFGYDVSLSGLENALKSGAALANDVIYRLVNKVNLSAGIECVLVAKKGREIAILQIGQPHVLLKRQNIITPLLTSLDFLPEDLSSGLFIPHRLLGINKTCYPHICSFALQPEDELIFLAHTFIPFSLLGDHRSNKPFILKDIFQDIVMTSPQSPFWISQLKL